MDVAGEHQLNESTSGGMKAPVPLFMTQLWHSRNKGHEDELAVCSRRPVEMNVEVNADHDAHRRVGVFGTRRPLLASALNDRTSSIARSHSLPPTEALAALLYRALL